VCAGQLSLTHSHSLTFTHNSAEHGYSSMLHAVCTSSIEEEVAFRRRKDSFVLNVRSLTRRSSVECRVDGWLFFVEFELDINLAHTFIDHNFDYSIFIQSPAVSSYNSRSIGVEQTYSNLFLFESL